MADELEEERGAIPVHRQAAQLVNHHQIQPAEVLNHAGQLMGDLSAASSKLQDALDQLIGGGAAGHLALRR